MSRCAFVAGPVGDVLAHAHARSLHLVVPAAVMVDHAGELLRNVAGSHSAIDCVLLLLACIAVGGSTASRQRPGASHAASSTGSKEPSQ